MVTSSSDPKEPVIHNQIDLVGSELWFQVTCSGSECQAYARPGLAICGVMA